MFKFGFDNNLVCIVIKKKKTLIYNFKINVRRHTKVEDDEDIILSRVIKYSKYCNNNRLTNSVLLKCR